MGHSSEEKRGLTLTYRSSNGREFRNVPCIVLWGGCCYAPNLHTSKDGGLTTSWNDS